MNRPLLIAATIVVLLVAAGVWYYRSGSEPPMVEEEPVAAVQPVTPPLPVEEPEPALPSLDSSDDELRQAASMLGLGPILVHALEDDDVMRRFVAVVDAVASGESPGRLLPMLAPKTPFDAVYRDDAWYMDPESYRRYDDVAEALAGLDATATVRALRRVEPLADAAYSDLVGVERRFETRLRDALGVLLGTPVVDEAPELIDAIGRLTYRDESLEALSLPQKHLLRMGPRNVGRIQAKLREILDRLAQS